MSDALTYELQGERLINEVTREGNVAGFMVREGGIEHLYAATKDGGFYHREAKSGTDTFSGKFKKVMGIPYDAEWIGPEGFRGLSNIDLSMSTSMQKGGCNISPRFVLTYVPNEEVNPNRFEIWAGLSFTRELFQKQ